MGEEKGIDYCACGQAAAITLVDGSEGGDDSILGFQGTGPEQDEKEDRAQRRPSTKLRDHRAINIR